MRLAVLPMASMPGCHWQAPSVRYGYPLLMIALNNHWQAPSVRYDYSYGFMPNYITYSVGTNVYDGMTTRCTECPVSVKPAYPVQTVLLKVTLGTKIN